MAKASKADRAAMTAAARAIEGEAPSETSRTMAPLLRAAVADYRRRVAEDFTPDRVGSLVATGPETWRELEVVGAILHRLVLMAHGGGRSSCAVGTMAVAIDGALIVVDEDDGLDDGERIHFIERSQVVVLD